MSYNNGVFSNESPDTMKSCIARVLLFCCLASAWPTAGAFGSAAQRSNRFLEVVLRDEATVATTPAGGIEVTMADKAAQRRLEALLDSLISHGAVWSLALGRDVDRLRSLRELAVLKQNRAIPKLENFLLVRLPHADSLVLWQARLREAPGVWYAEPLPQPIIPPAAPDFFPDQGYLQAAPDGMAAATLWDVPGGSGTSPSQGPVRVCDIEFSWNLDHVDLPPVTMLVPNGKTVWSPLVDDNHGTAVLGQLASKRDSVGTTGAVYDAAFFVAPSGLDSAWQVGVAIIEALTVLGEGDVLLIEHEMTGPTGEPVPIEWWPSWYAAVVTAVGNGVHVIEAAGNGASDLDAVIFSTGNGGHWPFRPENNSGAIIVGAGAAPASYGGTDTARSRLGYSNYGSRVDLQGWGEQVATTGFGYAYPLEGKNSWYTKTFSGTSSAAPMVAGAVAALESVFREATDGAHLSPAVMREILVTTGSPQRAGTYPISEQIGPFPNLPAAYSALPIECCQGTTGNVDCDPNEVISLTDLTRLINHLFVTFEPLCCVAEANVNADGDGVINLTDLTVLANHLFVTFVPLPNCASR